MSWTVLSNISQLIKTKIETFGIPLKKWDVKINYGIKTGFNEAFIITEEKRKELLEKCPEADSIIRPILRGRDIQKYNAKWAELYLINTHTGFLNQNGEIVQPIKIEDYTAVKNHLDKYYTQLSSRQDKGVTPYHLRSCIYTEEFFKPKIIWKRIGSVLRFSYDKTGAFCLDSTCFATGKDIKFLVGYLNSTISKRELLNNAPKTGTGDVITSVQALEPLLIPMANEDQKNEISVLVDKCLDDISNENFTRIKEYEYEIDKIIFSIFMLTEDEIHYITQSNTDD